MIALCVVDGGSSWSAVNTKAEFRQFFHLRSAVPVFFYFGYIEVLSAAILKVPFLFISSLEVT